VTGPLRDGFRFRVVFWAAAALVAALARLASAAAWLAFLARSARCSGVIVSKDRLPPLRPPLAPCSRKNSRTSGGRFFTAAPS